jgi:hypothetical protein
MERLPDRVARPDKTLSLLASASKNCCLLANSLTRDDAAMNIASTPAIVP